MIERAAPVAEPALATIACCDACAISTARVDLVVLEPERRRSLSRAAERRITVAGLLVSAGFLPAATAAVTLPEAVRRGLWLPVHIGLAGAAGTAVASVRPLFVAALSVAAPMGRIIRGGAIALIGRRAGRGRMGSPLPARKGG